MKLIYDTAYRLSQGMRWVAGGCLIAMVLAVLGDVVSRALFRATGGGIDATFTGGVEMVSHGLLFMVLFTLPHAVSRGQVIVDLFTERMSERLKTVLAGLYMLGYALLGAGMTLRFIEAVGSAAASGQLTQDLLIPLQYLYAVTAAATAALAVRALLIAIQYLAGQATAEPGHVS